MPTTSQLTQASISAASSGDNTLVSATAAQTARIFRIVLVASGAVSIKFKTGSTDLTGAMSLVSGGAIVLDMQSDPWFVTGTNEAFIANLSAAVQISGSIWYTKS